MCCFERSFPELSRAYALDGQKRQNIVQRAPL